MSIDIGESTEAARDLMGKGCSKENAISINDEIDEMDKDLTEADYKMRLEQKICTFKDTPEPICDLSECNLEKLPGNSLFSMVKGWIFGTIIL